MLASWDIPIDSADSAIDGMVLCVALRVASQSM